MGDFQLLQGENNLESAPIGIVTAFGTIITGKW